jgi:hypothetical protein
MIYVEIDEDSFIDRMNLAHKAKGHGFSEDGLKALFKYLSDAYSGDYLELHPNWISSAFIEYKDMNDVFKENEMSDIQELIKVDSGIVIVQNF